MAAHLVIRVKKPLLGVVFNIKHEDDAQAIAIERGLRDLFGLGRHIPPLPRASNPRGPSSNDRAVVAQPVRDM
ncbi:hypothetical protein OG937_16005 [Streptomyces sp. NBC_00510]